MVKTQNSTFIDLINCFEYTYSVADLKSLYDILELPLHYITNDMLESQVLLNPGRLFLELSRLKHRGSITPFDPEIGVLTPEIFKSPYFDLQVF